MKITFRRTLAALAASIAVASIAAACSAQSQRATTPTPAAAAQTPVATPQPAARPQATSPAGARAAVHATVTGAQPVLLPSAIVDAGWKSRVTTTSDSFLVTYTDLSGARTVTVGEGWQYEPNPPPPSATTTRTAPSFHGDRHSMYQVSDSANPLSPRMLMWREPGTYVHTDPSYPGIPYFVDASGITDADFWQLAHSLR
jgi:hypothetical protein